MAALEIANHTRRLMMNPERKADLLAQAYRILPDLLQVREQLEYEPEQTLKQIFPDTPAVSLAAARGYESAPGDLLDTAVEVKRQEVLDAGKRAIDRVRAEGANASLPPDEEAGLEAVISMMGRPALLFHNGRFDAPVAPWQRLEQVRESIERVAQSVGRINLIGNPLVPYGGTGFMVAEDLIMTNRHVARLFSRREAQDKWSFEPGMGAGINYREDPDATPAPQFGVKGIVAVHERYDLALLRVDSLPGAVLPPPLSLSVAPPSSVASHSVYVVGYPAYDHRNGADIMRVIFADIYNVKRLQPGTILEEIGAEYKLRHDCSTLGGNSGSCLLDLETHQVIGLHFSGIYLRYNEAFALWRLQKDPVIKKARLNYAH